MYSSSLANGSLCFLFNLPQLFDCGRRVHFNFHLLYILKFVFSFYRGIWSWFLIFFFLCSWSWSISIFCSSCFIFFVSGCWSVVCFIMGFRVLIRFCCSFIKFINSSFFLFVFIWLSFGGVFVILAKVGLMKRISTSPLASGKLVFCVT